MSRPGTRPPFIAPQIYRSFAAEYTRGFKRVDASLLAKYAPYFLSPREMYTQALFCRGSTLMQELAKKLIRVYRGRFYRGLRVSDFHGGFKLGQFAKPRTLAIFRQKASRKKKPTTASATSQLASEAQIAKIRQTKAGQRKRSIGKFGLPPAPQFHAA